MATDTDLPRRVRQLENERDSIYEILTHHGRRLDSIDSRLDEMQVTLGGMQATLAEVLRRLPDAS